MAVDPRRLRFLLAVARYGGVLAAADELAVTASAVSQQIAKLEAETGHTLLRRTPSGSVLTPAGLALAEAGEDIERALAVARSRLEEQDSEVTGTVRIGGFQSFLATVLVPSLPEWRERHPGLRFETTEGDEVELVRALRAGSVDAIVVELDAGENYTPPRGTADVPLLDEPWKLVVPTGALLAADVIDLSRLGLPWLGMDPNAASAKAIRRVRRELGGEESRQHSYSSFQNGLALVAAGEGVTLLPALALESLPTEGVDLVDVPGLGMRRVVLRHLIRGAAATPGHAVSTGLIREAAAAFSYESSGL
ncbi:MAG TPA: LysR family transcriptional regulator [Nocardioides bacterium]|uniref:LysR family transcriptional regulator n=1 Tax=uncultured Nocardioides sp. TaxID=198441 RepID=UPI000ED3CAF1|nr:LysR family transcriptional regulator [uncultured Nocardioides sp.]HCB03796.1 LysR family transcriptional regulator [Nocardioides sp.]HRD63362.1 LysR family transcriptional regulator [Nocardioides sp.]